MASFPIMQSNQQLYILTQQKYKRNIFGIFYERIINTIYKILNFLLSLGVCVEEEKVVNEGDTAQFKGKVPFSSSLKCVKWQRYQNRKYKDINIHKKKYWGSVNGLKNPILKINKAGPDDEVEYRLKVETEEGSTYSTVCSLRVLPILGNLFLHYLYSLCLRMLPI